MPEHFPDTEGQETVMKTQDDKNRK